MKLIGIAGTNGSGKDTVGNLLADRHDFLFVSMTDMLREELVRQGLPLDRKHMRELSAEWRRESGLGILIDKALALYDKDKYAGLACASLRNPGEVDRVHELDGIVIWIDADPKVRYERIQASTAERGKLRAVDDQKTFEQFLADEQAEMRHSGDAATLSTADVKAKADIFIENNDNNIEVLARKIRGSL